jgi:hypothetical protein
LLTTTAIDCSPSPNTSLQPTPPLQGPIFWETSKISDVKFSHFQLQQHPRNLPYPRFIIGANPDPHLFCIFFWDRIQSCCLLLARRVSKEAEKKGKLHSSRAPPKIIPFLLIRSQQQQQQQQHPPKKKGCRSYISSLL